MKTRVICFIILWANIVIGQNKSITVETDSDFISIDETIKVSFIVENIQGAFEAPKFLDFYLINGPFTSSSFQSINGEISSKSSYSYILKPSKKGELYIDEAYLKMQDTTLVTIPLKIIVSEANAGKKNRLSQTIDFDPLDKDVKSKITKTPVQPKKRKIVKI